MLTLFAGAGVDLQLGRSTFEAELVSDITLDNPSGGADLPLGTATITATDGADPSAGKLRFLGGLQLNIWALKLFTQFNMRPTRTFSVAFGARVAW
ncbi:MAG: hypothetical protein R3C68_17460 [Myxococcota bacterium]